MSELEKLGADAKKSLLCLFIAVPEEVAQDVNNRVNAYISALQKENAELERTLEEIESCAKDRDTLT